MKSDEIKRNSMSTHARRRRVRERGERGAERGTERASGRRGNMNYVRRKQRLPLQCHFESPTCSQIVRAIFLLFFLYFSSFLILLFAFVVAAVPERSSTVIIPFTPMENYLLCTLFALKCTEHRVRARALALTRDKKWCACAAREPRGAKKVKVFAQTEARRTEGI